MTDSSTVSRFLTPDKLPHTCLKRNYSFLEMLIVLFILGLVINGSVELMRSSYRVGKSEFLLPEELRMHHHLQRYWNGVIEILPPKDGRTLLHWRFSSQSSLNGEAYLTEHNNHLYLVEVSTTDRAILHCICLGQEVETIELLCTSLLGETIAQGSKEKPYFLKLNFTSKKEAPFKAFLVREFHVEDAPLRYG